MRFTLYSKLFITATCNLSSAGMVQMLLIAFRLPAFMKVTIYKVPRLACSASMDSNNAWKFPFPNDLAPLR